VPQYLNNKVGRAYICLIADGTCLTAINSPHGTENGQFGLSVVAMGDRFAVAAPLDGLHGTVYVFITTTGALYQTITLTSTATSGDYFGRSLAYVNAKLLIGAQTGGTSSVITPGAAFLYQPDGTLIRAFYNPDPTDPSYTSARFGAAVAGDGNTVLIGAPGADSSSGRAYLFDATTGALIDTFHKTSPAAGDHFGNAVALLGENFLVGAPDDRQGAAGAGRRLPLRRADCLEPLSAASQAVIPRPSPPRSVHKGGRRPAARIYSLFQGESPNFRVFAHPNNFRDRPNNYLLYRKHSGAPEPAGLVLCARAWVRPFT
jgi:FG-GAP repeat